MSQRSAMHCEVCSQFLCLSGDLPDWEWWLVQDDAPNVPVCKGCYERSSGKVEARDWPENEDSHAD